MLTERKHVGVIAFIAVCKILATMEELTAQMFA